MAYTISKGFAYIISLYTLTSLTLMHNYKRGDEALISISTIISAHRG